MGCRQYVEKLIAAQLVKDILAAGYAITVDDGEDQVIVKSADPEAIAKAMFSTDEDRLFVEDLKEGTVGWVYLVYGNDGTDVMSDYTTNLDELGLLKGAKELADQIEEA